MIPVVLVGVGKKRDKGVVHRGAKNQEVTRFLSSHVVERGSADREDR